MICYFSNLNYPMYIKKWIPNLVTLANLFCGTLAVVYAVNSQFEMVAYLVLLGIVFDFFDGFLARLLNVQSPLGKELDSLADAVTSGVVPGIVMFKLLGMNFSASSFQKWMSNFNAPQDIEFIQYFGLLLTLGAVYRLGKFNLDTRQSTVFYGLPTPAMSSFVVALPLILMHSDFQFITTVLGNQYVLVAIAVGLTLLMNIDLPLFSLKFKSYTFKDNKVQYIFVLGSAVLAVLLKFVAIPLIVIWYVLVSFILKARKD